MNYESIEELELINLLEENDENAQNIIYDKYSYIVGLLLKKYSRIIRYYKIPQEEIKAEAYLGFSDGIRSFTSNNCASLKTFLYVCVERKILKVIRHTMTLKIQVLNEALSLDYADDILDNTNASIKNFLFDDKQNPLNDMLEKETLAKIYKLAKNNLSSFEYNVFYFMANNFDYNEIAKLMDKSPKQIDNAINRIKSKMRELIEKEGVI